MSLEPRSVFLTPQPTSCVVELGKLQSGSWFCPRLGDQS